jgi:sulfur-carrier protein
MPRLAFTPQLRRFTTTPEVSSSTATTVLQLLEEAFLLNPILRGYVLDEQGHLRPNVAVFVDGQRQDAAVADGRVLAPESSVYVMQALSGG